MLSINPYYRTHSFLKNNNIQTQTAKSPVISSFAEKYNLSADTISFSRKSKTFLKVEEKSDLPGVPHAYVDTTYVNVLEKPLKSTPNINFRQNLAKVPGIISLTNAEERISSLSIYLKEKMIGFVVPEYELNGEHKGGYQWFERGLENLLKGSKRDIESTNCFKKKLKGLIKEPNKKIKFIKYKDTAKELFGLLSLHDNYWKSQDFVDYLTSLKKSKTIQTGQITAIDATVAAINELNNKKSLSFKGKQLIEMGGYFTPLKEIKELWTGAYSNHKLKFEKNKHFSPEETITAEHIFPNSWVPKEDRQQLIDDGNFLIVSLKANNERENMPLIEFLKGT